MLLCSSKFRLSFLTTTSVTLIDRCLWTALSILPSVHPPSPQKHPLLMSLHQASLLGGARETSLEEVVLCRVWGGGANWAFVVVFFAFQSDLEQVVWVDSIQVWCPRLDSDHQGRTILHDAIKIVSGLFNCCCRCGAPVWMLSVVFVVLPCRGRRGRSRRVINYRDLDAPEETY